VRGRRLAADDRWRGRVIERLMCDFTVDFAKVAPGADLSRELPILAPMVRDGLVEIADSNLVVTESGRPMVRIVAAVFDTYRGPHTAHFSKAV
jgi:oxygen-independent coproporphyrinogen-3 oxidase